jgi:succinyl-CoA synthetase alpha subunit
MPLTHLIVANTYRDSIALMQLSATLSRLPGVREAAAVMASESNLALLRDAGLDVGELAAHPADLLIVVRAKTEGAAVTALAHAQQMLASEAAGAQSGARASERLAPRSIGMAVEASPQANLALVSVPGEYAAAEARKALARGLHVMLFSDNVALEDELALKREAARRGLLVMGPDCGTAIIGGVPLGFANQVRRGSIGCIGASGTGLQQVTCLIDRLGMGVSHALGTGGRDLSQTVGGLSMLQSLRLLARDPGTRVIVLIGKPPAPAVAKALLAAAAKVKKPVVVNFLGADLGGVRAQNLYPVRTLEDAARAAAALARGKRPPRTASRLVLPRPPRLSSRQRYLRGLFSGGTFCHEAAVLLGDALGKVWSNTPLRAGAAVADPWTSHAHTLIDLGDDVFTRGRLHPMLDHRLRNERIVREARDPEVGVILLDVVLGHGAHPNPAAEMIPAIAAARQVAAAHRRRLVFVASVCGTPGDPQGLEAQEAALRRAGVILGRSNAQAVRAAAAILRTRERVDGRA